MTSDGELLRRYAEAKSEDAFAELVRRHLDLVYSAALRQVNGDAHLAQDVAQTVFADLARKAASLSQRAILTGWLYTSTHFAAAKAVRTERRRHKHEQEAQLMHELLQDSAPDLDWEKLCPVLDAAMLELNESDREAVLLRYFENRQHAEIAARLGLTENAARMRVERALEKLRDHLSRRGITTAAAALSIVISANAVQAAPAGLAVTISTAAATLTGTTLASTTISTTTKAIAMTTLQKVAVGAALAAAVGTALYETELASQLRRRVSFLQQQLIEQEMTAQHERADTDAKIAALQTENDRARDATQELVRLRGEVARLRTSQTELSEAAKPSPPANEPPVSTDPRADNNELPKESWADAGFGTPQDALRTRGWAVLNGNRERFKESLFITPTARKTLEDMLVQMASASSDPDKAQLLQEVVDNKYGVEEAILLPMMAKNQANNFTGYRILSEQLPSADEADLDVETQMASGQTEKQTLKFRRIGSDWKVVIDDDFVRLAR